MAISPRYALRETGQNLWRNVLLSAATVITIGVSLWLFGGFLLFDAAVDNATQRWEGGIEFVVWMNPDATAEQDAVIQQTLEESEGTTIREWTYVDQQATFEEFQEIFAGEPELLDAVTAEDLPPSYRVAPIDPDAAVIDELSAQFAERPGVRKVVSASDTVKAIQEQADRIGVTFFIGSIVLLVAATLLILTNIVSAIQNRSQEIEIMKVVGATNWFIRIPFMLEGLAHALMGVLLAWVGLLVLDRRVIAGFDSPDNALELLQGFRVEPTELYTTGLIVLGVAVLAAAIGSMFAVTRYLDA
mgnify:FL=1